ncbi:MAG: phosphoribosylaminoimidazolesuccinocarboxamide synthase [Candidatus Saccharimonadia bacterium]
MSSIRTPKPIHVGKVRESYEAGAGRLLVRATDRISVFDVVLPTLIPGKGRVLTELTSFWLEEIFQYIPNHLITTFPLHFPAWARDRADFNAQSMLVQRANMLPLECIVRGYLYGSVMGEYEKFGTASGITLPNGLQKASMLSEPIFTPSTKAATGHDENISMSKAGELVDPAVLGLVEARSLEVFRRASQYCFDRGIILADTKFEFGFDVTTGELLLCDEVLTPDSSRFWELSTWEPGREPVSYDKQYVRNFTQTLCDRGDWDKTDPGPELPEEIVAGTQAKYREILTILAGDE